MTHAAANTALGVGASLLRKEDARHLRGRGQFVSDVKLAHTQDIAFVRSPHAHARIKGITVPPDAVGRVFSARELPRLAEMRAVPQVTGFKVSGYPPLATQKVRYVGEAIAACIAPTRAEAEDLANRVSIDFAVLPAVIDASAALNGAPSLVHESWPNNLFIERVFQNGNIEEVARAADVVVRRNYRMHRHVAVPLEGRAVLAYRDHRLDELVVYTSTQVPHIIRLGLSEVLGLEERRIRVIAPDVGGGFGSKARLSPEEAAVAALALELDHPVRWVEDRGEHFLASTHTRDHDYRVAAYADKRGRVLGIDVELIVDGGAYAMWPNGPFLETGMAARNLPGPYDIRNYRVKTYTVATNKSPIGPYRGVGRPGACFAIERTIDEVARAVGRDPTEVRMENMVTSAQMPYTTIANLKFDSGDYPAAVKLCADAIDLPAVRARQRNGEPDGRLIGVGFACYSEQTGHGCGEWVSRGSPFIPGYESCTAQLMPDGTLVLSVGIQSHGQGLETTLAQIAHQELGIDPAKISVRHGDTGVSPFGMGTIASRSIVMAGGAVANACNALLPRFVAIGAHLMQAAVNTARYERGEIVGPQKSVSLREVAEAWYLRPQELPPDVDLGGLEATVGFRPKRDSGAFSYASHAAVVAVDTRIGAVEILDYVIVEDCGTRVNPMVVEGQTLGGAAQGIGTALYEESPFDANGQPLASTFADYLLPGPTEIPAIRIYHLETPSPYTEFGIKGMGEGGAIAPPAVIFNAVNDALRPLGVELTETPLTPRRMLEAIDRAKPPTRTDAA
jgi:carbon-monoxide dehydrogenase large subunit